MTSAPCPSHPKARFQHFCGECGRPTSSFGRQMREKNEKPREPVVKFHNQSQCEGGDDCTLIQIDNLIIRVRNRDLRTARDLKLDCKVFMIDARSVEPLKNGAKL